jgi:hypothetical protein
MLFIHPSEEDYVADSVFHGLRSELGPEVVDFPKIDFAYDTYPTDLRASLYGHGFTLYGLLPDIRLIGGACSGAPFRASARWLYLWTSGARSVWSCNSYRKCLVTW